MGEIVAPPDSHQKLVIDPGVIASEIMSHGCDGFIQKPFTLVDLRTKIRKALMLRRATDDSSP